MVAASKRVKSPRKTKLSAVDAEQSRGQLGLLRRGRFFECESRVRETAGQRTVRVTLPEATTHSEQRSDRRDEHESTVVLHPSRDLIGRHEPADEDGSELREGGSVSSLWCRDTGATNVRFGQRGRHTPCERKRRERPGSSG